ncbi:DUF4124 domain-containing protein [Mangrovitalea sediminis]|uniref:DUF4124 domain-containing protein n=1 Tax=Mangrovitalea sediminis TaxID=1982043 RepID=UPI000BE51EC8|nr:DUF4124 domain-containing protein [Mangrovitalea sediminis]
MKLRVGIAGLALSLLANVAFAGAVYVWTVNGVKHYSDQKPDGVKAEQLQVMTGSAVTDNGTPTNDQPPAANATDAANTPQNAEAQKQKAEQEKIRQENCAAAKRNLDVLNTYSRIKVTEGGKTRYLTPEEVATKKQQFEKLEKEYCGTPAASQ